MIQLKLRLKSRLSSSNLAQRSWFFFLFQFFVTVFTTYVESLNTLTSAPFQRMASSPLITARSSILLLVVSAYPPESSLRRSPHFSTTP